MKFSAIAVFSAITGMVAATPQYRPTTTYPTVSNPWAPGYSSPVQPTGPKVTCLTTDTANTLIKGFASLLTNYNNATAGALLASDFTDTSDSINQLAGYPIGSTTFPSKQAFQLGQGSQPKIDFTVLSVDEVTCTNVAFRWSAGVGKKLFPIKGINSFVASNLNGTDQGWQLKTMYSEFNSLGWFLNVGGQIIPPSS
ncbi:hypothetical protein H2198_002204 [Neophaeococcomyces mojaviensis]|uniref:Uncharacterized protein n=1 Tax=Neophaeococcomyces mojaviensis TaxID=3383035 RepID=A0ACC3AF41_9EURO|nr:hypothetical protein H2198_002204 [Knufia sp. JES_112]